MKYNNHEGLEVVQKIISYMLKTFNILCLSLVTSTQRKALARRHRAFKKNETNLFESYHIGDYLNFCFSLSQICVSFQFHNVIQSVITGQIQAWLPIPYQQSNSVRQGLSTCR